MTECKAEPDSICLLRAGWNSVFGCHSRPGGNVLHKPLDSSFRWNDGGGDKYIWATF